MKVCQCILKSSNLSGLLKYESLKYELVKIIIDLKRTTFLK